MTRVTVPGEWSFPGYPNDRRRDMFDTPEAAHQRYMKKQADFHRMTQLNDRIFRDMYEYQFKTYMLVLRDRVMPPKFPYDMIGRIAEYIYDYRQFDRYATRSQMMDRGRAFSTTVRLAGKRRRDYGWGLILDPDAFTAPPAKLRRMLINEE